MPIPHDDVRAAVYEGVLVERRGLFPLVLKLLRLLFYVLLQFALGPFGLLCILDAGQTDLCVCLESWWH